MAAPTSFRRIAPPMYPQAKTQVMFGTGYVAPTRRARGIRVGGRAHQMGLGSLSEIKLTGARESAIKCRLRGWPALIRLKRASAHDDWRTRVA